MDHMALPCPSQFLIFSAHPSGSFRILGPNLQTPVRANSVAAPPSETIEGQPATFIPLATILDHSI